MKKSFAVHVSECLEGLKADISNLMMPKFAFILKHLKDIVMHILKDKKELVIFFDNFQ